MINLRNFELFRIMAVSRSRVLSLYKSLLREAFKFPVYNYRMYALRRIKDSFRENSSLNESKSIELCYSKGTESLEVIKRQVLIANLYKAEKLVIE